MNADATLSAPDPQGCWAWAGMRVLPVLGGPPAYAHTGLDADRLVELVADDEAAWLAALWGLPEANGESRFELRYRNDLAGITEISGRDVTGGVVGTAGAANPPTSGRSGPSSPAGNRPRLLDCACLCRVRAADPAAAERAALVLRDRLAGVLPGHVRAEPLADRAGLRAWLVPFEAPAVPSGQAEITKDLVCRPLARPVGGRNAVVAVSRYCTVRVPWEWALRRLAELPFPALLTVGFKPFPRSEQFRTGLERLADEYARLARPARGLPIYDGAAGGDGFAQYAADRCAQYARQYDGPAFQLRISLAAAGPLPADLPAWLARSLSGRDADPGTGARVAVPVPGDRAAAWRNVASLGGAWLRDTYLGPLPDAAVGPVERELLNLADLAEARSVLQLPVAWPGRPPLHAGLAGPAVGSPGTELEFAL